MHDLYMLLYALSSESMHLLSQSAVYGVGTLDNVHTEIRNGRYPQAHRELCDDIWLAYWSYCKDAHMFTDLTCCRTSFSRAHIQLHLLQTLQLHNMCFTRCMWLLDVISFDTYSYGLQSSLLAQLRIVES